MLGEQFIGSFRIVIFFSSFQNICYLKIQLTCLPLQALTPFRCVSVAITPASTSGALLGCRLGWFSDAGRHVGEELCNRALVHLNSASEKYL